MVNIHVSVDLLMGETNVATGNEWFFQLVSDRTNVAVRREDLRKTRDEPLQPKAIFDVGNVVDPNQDQDGRRGRRRADAVADGGDSEQAQVSHRGKRRR